MSHGALLVAGGANFPNGMPGDHGSKVWYDTVYVLESPKAKWKLAGHLPRMLGYGTSVTIDDGVICIGGGDQNQNYADVFRLQWINGALTTTKMPSLPQPTANLSGALVGNYIYAAGGIATPDASDTIKSAWRINLCNRQSKWEPIDSCPGSGRMLAIACGADGAFWQIGGVDLKPTKQRVPQRLYLRDSYRYDPDRGWKQIADLPHALAAAPSPAPFDKTGFYILGGDDGSQTNIVPDKHRGFSKSLLKFDLARERWIEAGELKASRVTTPCVRWNDSWVILSGEVRPGVRSPEVWSWDRH